MWDGRSGASTLGRPQTEEGQLETDTYRGFKVRPESGADKGAVREGDWKVFIAHLRPDDIVADIGAHIGTTTRKFQEAGVRQVLAFEPEPDNFTLLRLNTDEDAILVEAAVATAVGYAALSVSKSTMSHSLRQKRGALAQLEVPTVAFRDVLEDPMRWGAVGPITAAKIDCEGGEFLFKTDLLALPDTLRLVAIEFHKMQVTRDGQAVPSEEQLWAKQICDSLLGQGFTFIDGPRITPGTFKNNWSVVAERC
jgi:FkbM family methyltransferase